MTYKLRPDSREHHDLRRRLDEVFKKFTAKYHNSLLGDKSLDDLLKMVTDSVEAKDLEMGCEVAKRWYAEYLDGMDNNQTP